MAQIRNANIGVRKARRASVENPKIYPEKNFEISWKKIKKTLAIYKSIVYTNICCDMIAMKREVAARQMNKLVQVFRGANVKLGNWRQVTVRIKN